MTQHSSTLAWRIPWTEEPGGLQSMGLQSRTQRGDFTFTLGTVLRMFTSSTQEPSQAGDVTVFILQMRGM